MPYYNWSNPPSNKSILTSQSGGIDQEVFQILLKFDENYIKAFFKEYEYNYGKPASKYIEKNFNAWQYGSKKPSAETLKKLILLVPRFLNSEQRFNLFKKMIYNQKIHKKVVNIDIEIQECIEKFIEVENNINKELTAYSKLSFNNNMLNIAEWVYDSDMILANEIIKKIKIQEMDLIKINIKKEINNLKVLVNKKTQLKYTIEIPTATFNISVYKKGLWETLFGK